MCICDYVKNHIGTCKKCVFRFEKEYKRISVLDSCKTYCWCQMVLVYGDIPTVVQTSIPLRLKSELLAVRQSWELAWGLSI